MSVKAKATRSLRTRVFLLAAGLSSLTAVALGALGYRMAVSGLRERTESALSSDATLVATLTDAWARDRLEGLRSLAGQLEVRRILETVASPTPEDQVAAEHALLNARGVAADLESVALADVDGKVFMSTSTDDEGVDARASDYFQATLKGGEYDGAAVQLRDGGGPFIYLAAAVIGSNAEPIGAARQRLALDSVLRTVAAARDRTGPGGGGVLLDASGRVLASTWPGLRAGARAAESLAGLDAALAQADPPRALRFSREGAAQLGVLLPIPSLGWRYLAGLPLAQVERVANAFLLRAGLGALAGLVLATLLSLAVASRAVRSVTHLTEVTSRIVATNDLTQEIDVHGDDEVGRLAESFRQMVESLRERNQALVDSARTSDARFRAAFQTIPDAVLITRLSDLRVVAVNEGFQRLTGWTEAEVDGKTIADLRLVEDMGLVSGLVEQMRGGGALRDVRISLSAKSGSVFSSLVSSRAFRAGDEQYTLTVIRDVTEQDRAERARAAMYRIAGAASAPGTLRQLLGQIHEVLGELMPVPNFFIALQDAAGGQLQYAYHVDEEAPRPIGPQRPRRGLTEAVLRTGQPLVVGDRAQLERLIADGVIERDERPPKSWIGLPLETQQRTTGVLAAQSYRGGVSYGPREVELLQYVCSQVAAAIERKQGEEALRASEWRFRALIENASDGIWLIAADGATIYASPAVEQMLGRRAGDQPKNLRDHLHAEDAAAVEARLQEVLADASKVALVEARAHRADGSVATLEASIRNRLADPAVRGVVLNLRDVSERKRMEGRLMMADRMVSVGTLAAGVAHEINNPLAYVLANLAYIADMLATPERAADVADALAEAREGAERVRLIVRDLKTFSRGDDLQQSAVDVHRVLDASANMAWNEIRHRARLIKDYARELPAVIGNESRLGQVLLNLLVNAAQAIPEGRAEANQIRVRTRAESGQVIIEVADTGVGIAPENAARLFDPFFTTKPVGEGTGLGLFICQNIIHSMGGEISVSSTPGQGATFRVALPCSEAAVRLTTATAPMHHRGGAQTLVIDDEPLVAAALKRVLPDHQVTIETSAPAALARLKAGARFDLIFCDVMMPEMTGVDFYRALAADAPEQAARVVFVTGGAFTAAAREFLAAVPNKKLEKPLDLQRLREVIDELSHPQEASAAMRS